MSEHKRKVRAEFRAAVFARDGNRCRLCKVAVYDRQAPDADRQGDRPGDAHHITPREQMPYGGYVHENGITLCDDCHRDVEGGSTTPHMLYHTIDTTPADAVVACDRLSPEQQV